VRRVDRALGGVEQPRRVLFLLRGRRLEPLRERRDDLQRVEQALFLFGHGSLRVRRDGAGTDGRVGRLYNQGSRASPRILFAQVVG
jgi:hypothetical protein